MENKKFMEKFPELSNVIYNYELMESIISRKNYFGNLIKFLNNIPSDLILLWDREAYDEYDECFMKNFGDFSEIISDITVDEIFEIMSRIIIVEDKKNIEKYLTPRTGHIVLGNHYDDIKYFINDSILYFAYKQETINGTSIWIADTKTGKILNYNMGINEF